MENRKVWYVPPKVYGDACAKPYPEGTPGGYWREYPPESDIPDAKPQTWEGADREYNNPGKAWKKEPPSPTINLDESNHHKELIRRDPPCLRSTAPEPPEPEEIGDEEETVSAMVGEIDSEEETHLRTSDDEKDREEVGDAGNDNIDEERVLVDYNLRHAILPKTGRLLYGYIGGDQRRAMIGAENAKRVIRINEWTKANIKNVRGLEDLDHNRYNTAIYNESRFRRNVHVDIERRVISEGHNRLVGVYLSQINVSHPSGESLINKKKVRISYNKILAEADEATLRQVFEVNHLIPHDHKLETFRRLRKFISKRTGIKYQEVGRHLNNIYKENLINILIDQMAYVPLDETRIWFRTSQWRMALMDSEQAGIKQNKSLWDRKPMSPLFDYCTDWEGCIDHNWMRKHANR